ncbi:MBL fold metallo-hydrolase [Paenibacillus sp. KN14-4R]|uniref:MBL fold metallo-hydrolase n=1 Tax=Paenibacillus sp. KN14-4R TaxID=3445773 RepID=UPI003F9F5679
MEDNHYFTLEQVAEGVWAAIVVPGSGALGNAAILDLGDITIVVDTFMLPEAGSLLRQAAVNLTGREVEYVVNTHFHGDHHYGNQAFVGSTFVSTAGTRDFLNGLESLDYEKWQLAIREQIVALTHSKAIQTDERVRQALTYEISDKEHLYVSVPTIRRVLASMTFTDRFVIHGSKRTAEVMTWGGGHTMSDAFVYIPEDKVLVAGDLVLGKSHPAMLHGNSESWVAILDQIGNELEVNCVIPGHGPVTGSESITEMKNYIKDIEIYAKKAADSDQSIDFWLDQGDLEPYDSWLLSHVFEWNLRHLFKKYQVAKMV